MGKKTSKHAPDKSRRKASGIPRKKKRASKKINARSFMRLAIDEMLLSRSGSRSKTDPLVGAVLVNSVGRVLARAHRGKYGAGDHGEFSLFEKLDATVPVDCTLY